MVCARHLATDRSSTTEITVYSIILCNAELVACRVLGKEHVSGRRRRRRRAVEGEKENCQQTQAFEQKVSHASCSVGEELYYAAGQP